MKKIQLTLRARLTVWMAALLIISGIILVIVRVRKGYHLAHLKFTY